MDIAIIPARGNSKRIPGKNTRMFCGRPIIAYSIQAALASSSIDEVWVSTDDPGIAEIANKHGARTPFPRPAALADDFTVMRDVVVHVIDSARGCDLDIRHVCMLFATAPFLLPDDIEKGRWVLESSGADLALSVAEYRSAPQRAQIVDDRGFLQYSYPEYCNTRSQDLQPMFHDAAQFVWGKADAFHTPVTHLDIAPVSIPAERVVDIDTVEDWNHAEHLYRAWQRQSLDLAA